MIDLTPATHRMVELLDAITDVQLDLPTPCPDETVGDLIDHVGMFAVRFRDSAHKTGEPGAAPTPASANLEAGWRARIRGDLVALGDAWNDPQAWEGTTHAGGMEMPAEVVGLVALDELIVHGWDLAVATSRPYAPSESEIDAVTAFVAAFDAPRDGTLFGPEVATADTAPALDRLLGLTGRDPGWAPRGGPARG
jgi:uncharacterized protein (TIGR03086 family)